jgi:hypothetical protein
MNKEKIILVTLGVLIFFDIHCSEEQNEKKIEEQNEKQANKVLENYNNTKEEDINDLSLANFFQQCIKSKYGVFLQKFNKKYGTESFCSYIGKNQTAKIAFQLVEPKDNPTFRFQVWIYDEKQGRLLPDGKSLNDSINNNGCLVNLLRWEYYEDSRKAFVEKYNKQLLKEIDWNRIQIKNYKKLEGHCQCLLENNMREEDYKNRIKIYYKIFKSNKNLEKIMVEKLKNSTSQEDYNEKLNIYYEIIQRKKYLKSLIKKNFQDGNIFCQI